MNQYLKSNNHQAVLENLTKSNPQMQQAWQISQALMNNKNMSKEQQLEQACRQSGTDINQVKQALKSFGINI